LNTNWRITKIKVKKGEYFFAWEIYQKPTKNWDKYSLNCKDFPREEFKESLQKMANHVTQICEFEESATKKIVVSGISLSYTDKNRYLVITALKDLTNSKSPLIINTPARPEMSDGAVTAEFCMSKELVWDLENLVEEALRYINGDRAQQKLDFDEQKNTLPAGGSETGETRAAG